jgi:hypothetical protein
MKRTSRSWLTVKQCLPWLALSCSVLLYGLHFFAGGGRTKLITDSDAYLLMSRGEQLGAPFASRVLAPFIASVIASVLGATNLAAFQILTLVALLGSMLLLRKLISSQGGSVEWQAAVLLSLGCALAATFGYTPVMVDPLLLFLTCLTVMALDCGYFSAAVALASLAALTKEYGLLLGLVISVVAYRRGHRKLAYVGLLLPALTFLVATLALSGSPGVGFLGWQSFLSAMFSYHTYLFRFRGASEYPKLLYMWSWSVLWPVLVIAGGVVLSRLRNRIKMSDHEAGFSLMLVALPFLLLGDWGRALLIVVPFGCVVATSHPLARNAQFTALVAIGGLSTALARPFHSEPPPPLALTLTMTVISIASSLLIAVKILRFVHSGSSSQLDPVLDNPAPEVAAR